MGKIIHVKGAVVSIGDKNDIHDVNVTLDMTDELGDDELRSLAGDLGKLRQVMQSKAVSTDDVVELGLVAQAEKKALANDRHGVIEALKGVGSWTLGAATDLGVALLVEVIKKSSGLS